jgi:hypothetical protein
VDRPSAGQQGGQVHDVKGYWEDVGVNLSDLFRDPSEGREARVNFLQRLGKRMPCSEGIKIEVDGCVRKCLGF